MAENRTNMVSLLDIGKLNGGTVGTLAEMGDGYTELTEDWGPKTDSKQYVNMDAESTVVNGYSFSMSPEREYMSDGLQACIDKLSKEFPIGSKCETYYYRFYKTDATGTDTMTVPAIKVPVVVMISSVGGSGGESLKSTIQINGNGNVQQCTISYDGSKYTEA